MSVTAPDSTQAQTAPAVQGQPVTTPAPPVQPVPGQGDGPWASELATRFTDPNVRAAVDGFLREKVQPYITQVEQKAKPNERAEALYKDLTDSPLETFLAITEELFDADAAQVVVDALSNAGSPAAPQMPVDDGTQQQLTPAQQAALAPEDKEVLDWARQQRTSAAWNTEMERLKAAHPDAKLTDALISPFVAVNDGDFDAAFAAYTEHQNALRSDAGVLPAMPAPAPPAMGSEAAAGSVPPTQPTKQTFDEAIADFAADIRAAQAAPTTVGTV